MRLTKYVKSDGESWMMVKIRCSVQAAYSRLDALMLQNGWVHFSDLKEKFNRLKQRIARQDPVKYPDWKRVVIPMHKGKIADLPMEFQVENEKKQLALMEDIPFTDEDAKQLITARPETQVFDDIESRTPEQKKDALSLNSLKS